MDGQEWQLDVPGCRSFRCDREVEKEGVVWKYCSDGQLSHLGKINKKRLVTLMGLCYRPLKSTQELEETRR